MMVRFLVKLKILLFAFRNSPASAAVRFIPFCTLTPKVLNAFTRSHSKDVKVLKID